MNYRDSLLISFYQSNNIKHKTSCDCCSVSAFQVLAIDYEHGSTVFCPNCIVGSVRNEEKQMAGATM